MDMPMWPRMERDARMKCPKCDSEEVSWRGTIFWDFDKKKQPILTMRGLICNQCDYEWDYDET